MVKTMLVFFFVTVSTMIVFSCTKSSGGNNPVQNNCPGTPGTLFLSVRTIIQNNCAVSGCHTTPNPQNDINFSDNCTIIAQKDHIKTRAVNEAGTPDQMPPPPNPALPLSDRQKILDWINAGGRITD